MLGKLLLTTAVVLAAMHSTSAQGLKPVCKDGRQPSQKINCKEHADCPPNHYCLRMWAGFICCPFPTEECPRWTPWTDIDNPLFSRGDEEWLRLLRILMPGVVCDHPIDIQARDPKIIGPDINAEDTREIFLFYDVLEGFVCLNGQQKHEIIPLCEDYEVRYCCPAEFEPEPIPDPVPEPPPRPPCSIDIIIVLDVSSSMSLFEFFRLLWYLIEFILCFDVDVRIGIITYECLPYLDVPLGAYSLNDTGLLDAIGGLQRRGGRTRTGLALHYVKCMTDFRPDTWSVVILVSDGTETNGQGTNDYLAQAGMLRDSGFAMYGVAVGYPFLVNKAGLGAIVGGPDRVVDPNDPCTLANRIIDECCGP